MSNARMKQWTNCVSLLEKDKRKWRRAKCKKGGKGRKEQTPNFGKGGGRRGRARGRGKKEREGGELSDETRKRKKRRFSGATEIVSDRRAGMALSGRRRPRGLLGYVAIFWV